GRDLKRNQTRAQNSIDAIKAYELLDLNRVADGVYKNSAQGYSSVVSVEVTVAARKIADVKITDHHEKQYYNSIAEMPKRILARQSVKGVDTFSSATITSEAIINAAGKALAGGMK
ncbi:MAG: FMN-binding protein, partial [Planctomycetota bacterium]|nr:FMN-binding protein [Planctomycetota bacterium]